MKLRFLSLIGLLIIISSTGVFAADVDQIAIENCGWDMANLATLECGMTPTYSCQISDNTGATQINDVVYTLGGVDYTAERTSGTALNGTWAVTITASEDLITRDAEGSATRYDADGVWVQNAASEVCEGAAFPLKEYNCGPNNVQCLTTTGCFIQFNANQFLDSQCACSFESTEQCSTQNVLTTFFTPGAGCSVETEAYQTTGVCDYCDPGWKADSFVCNINRSEGDGFTGSTIVTFSPSDAQACCIATGLASDCQAPSLDNQELTCNQGYWLSEYNDVSATRKNAGNKIFTDSYDIISTPQASLFLSGGNVARQLQPVVFDIDDDGTVETISFINPASAGNGQITIRNPQLELELIYNLNRTILGDAGVFEFDARQGLSPGFISGANGLGLAVITDGGSNHMQIFRYQNDTLEELHDISLSDDQGGFYGEAASVFCDQDYCYTVVGGNTLVQVHAVTGSVTKMPFPSSSAIADATWRNMPAKVPDFFSALGDIIVSKGFDSSGNVVLAACYTSGAYDCETISLGTPDPINVSEIYIGPRISDGGQFKSPVFVSVMSGGKIYYRAHYVLHSDTPTWSNPIGITKDNLGVDPECVIAPAAAECPQEGVFFASTWIPATVVSSILQDIEIPFSWTDVESNSFNQMKTTGTYSDPLPYSSGGTSLPYVAVNNEHVAAQYCSKDSDDNDICYIMSGITGQYQYSSSFDWTKSDLYISVNGGAWSGIDNNPNLNSYPVGDGSATVQYQNCTISDNTIAWGAVDGDLYAVRTRAVEASGVSVGSLNSIAGTVCSSSTPYIQDRWAGLYVDRYDEDTDTWTEMWSEPGWIFDSDGTWPTGGDEGFANSIGKRMECDSDRCLHYWIDEDGEQGVLEIYAFDQYYKPGPSVNNARPGNQDILGADLSNYNSGGRYIVGYAGDSYFDYFAFRSPSTGGSGFVGQYAINPLAPGGVGTPALVSPVAPSWVTIQGLRADPNNAFDTYYAMIPHSTGANTTANFWCPFKSNSSGPEAAFASDDGDFVYPADGEELDGAFRYSAAKRHSYTVCNYEIWKVDQGFVPGAPYYTDQVRRWSDNIMSGHYSAGARIPDYGLIVGPSIGWSIGDFDENGEYYTAYIDSMCLGSSGSCLSKTGSWRAVCCPSYNWYPGDPYGLPNSAQLVETYAILQKGNGVTFPLLNYWDDVAIFGVGSTDPSYISSSSYDLTDLRKRVSSAAGINLEIDKCPPGSQLNNEAGESGCKPFGVTNALDISTPYALRYSNTLGGAGLDGLQVWSSFDATAKRLTIGHVGLNKPVYAVIGDSSLSSDGYTELGCYVPSLTGLSKIGGSVIDIIECPAQLLSSDVDRDGTDEIVLSRGMYEYLSGEKIVNFNQPEGSSFGIVDFTSDSFLDVVFVTSNNIRHITSIGDLNVQFAGELGLQTLACVYDSNSGEVTASFIGVSTEHPDSLTYSGDLYEEGNAVKIASVGAQSSAEITFSPRSTGVHEINGFVQDTISGERVGQTCIFTVGSLPASQVITYANISTDLSCSIAPAGEFNYDSSVQSYDWFIDQNRAEPLLDGSKATFNKQDINMLHGLACEDPEMSATLRVKPTTSTNYKLIIQAEDWGSGSHTGSGIATDWTIENIGGLWIYGQELWVWDDGDSPRKILDELSITEFSELKLTFDRNANQYTVSLNDVVIETVNLWNGNFKGAYSGVIMRSLEGLTYVDYIRTTGLTGSAEEILLPGQVSDEVLRYTLANCRQDMIDEDFRNFTENPVGNVSHPAIDAWCDSKGIDTGEQTICEFEQLKEAVRINPDCYQEAFTYCVEVTYPLTAGFQDPNKIQNENMRTEQGVDLNGAAACSIALQTQSASSSIFSPLWNLMWSGTLANPIFAMVLIFVLVIGVAIYAKKK